MSEGVETAGALIRRLAAAGIRLWVEGDQLRYRGAAGAMAAVDLGALRQQREQLKIALAEEGCLFPAHPASEAQRAQWFISEFLGAADPAYHLLAAVDLAPAIDMSRLEAALHEVAARHEILRTRYLYQAGVLWQAAGPAPADPLPLRAVDAGEEALTAALDAFAAAPFDLRRGQVFRAAAFVLPGAAEPRRVLALAVHHIACDFLSLQELLLELDSILAGEPLRPAMPFGETVQAGSGGEDQAGRIAALGEALRPFPPATHLAPAPMGTERGGHAFLRWDLGGDDARRLLAAASSLGVTPFAICLTAFGIAAASMTGRSAVGLNLAAAAPRPAHAAVLGDFANFVPFVARARAADRLQDAVLATFTLSHKLLQLRDIPFKETVSRLGIAGDDPISPFSHLAFAWHRETPAGARAAARLGEVLPASRQLGAPGGLMLTGREQRGRFSFAIAYREAWLGADWVEALRTCFDRVLAAVAEQRECSVGSAIGPLPALADRLAAPPAAPSPARVSPPVSPLASPASGLDRAAAIAALAEQIAVITGAPAVDPEASIFDLGITSVSAIELRRGIRQALGVDIPLSTLFELASVEAIAACIAGEETRERADAEDAALPVPAACAAGSPAAAPRAILLTGATGFLGSRILAALLAQPDVRPVCLVRAPDARTAELKLVRSLAAAGIVLPAADAARLTIVAGHVGSGRLGQPEDEYRRMTEELDAVVHAAAQVNFSLPYPALRGNALGALEVARLCMEGRPKPLHFVSTYSVLDPGEAVNAERLLVDEHPFLDLGYARSKWVAERLLARASGNGLACRIYRPSRIVTGRPGDPLNRNDFYSLLLAGAVAAGAVPRDAGFDNFVDVGGVAGFIAAAAAQPIADTRAVHLCGGAWTPWSEIVDLVGAAVPGLERLDYPAWAARVLAVAERDPSLAGLAQLRPFLTGQADRLRTCLLHRHPRIERGDAAAWPALDVRFDRRLVEDHLAQIAGPRRVREIA